MPRPLPLLLLSSSLLVLAACGGDEKTTPPATSATALAPSTAQASKTLIRMTIDPSGVATFDMKAPLEDIKGTVRGFGGDLEIELSDLTKTRGKITIDVSTLETHTFGEEAKDQSQSEHARTWLEVGPKTADDKKQKNRLAEFAIREIVNPSTANVMTMSGDSRSVTLTAKGDLLLHGRSVNLSLDLACAFQFEGDKLKSIAIKSAKPATVNLKAHQIEARDDAGEVAIAKTLELFGKKVADDASVTFEVMARPPGEKGLPPAAPAPTAAASGAPSAGPSALSSATPSGAPSAAPTTAPKAAP